MTHARARCQIWWLLAVFLLGVLAPSLSAALSHAQGDFNAWHDFCRASTANNAAKREPVEAALDLLAKGHCPACHLGATGFAGPSTVPPLALRNDLTLQAPKRFWTAHVTSHVWRPASARDPPAL